MGDWEATGSVTRERRTAPKSALQQSKADLLQAIAARRQAQLLRSNKAPSPPTDGVSGQTSLQFDAEAKIAASKLLPESSEGSGTSGDEEAAYTKRSTSTSSLGTNQTKSNMTERRRLCRPQAPENHCTDDDLIWAGAETNGPRSKFSQSTTSDDLSNSLSTMSIKEHDRSQFIDNSRASERQYYLKPKESISAEKKRLVKKSTVVTLGSDSEVETFHSPGRAMSSPSVECTSADDGDVDSPIPIKMKSKIYEAGVTPLPKLSGPSGNLFSNEDEENVFDLGIKEKPNWNTSRMPTSQLQTKPKAETVQAPCLAIDTGVEDDMVLVEGRQSYTLRAKIAHMLYPHQREGIKWLWGLHTKGMGGILGDDMGLGKTMQIASFLAGLFCSRNIKCALIVAPKTLIAHWVKELKVVGLGRKTQDYSGTSARAREFALQHVLQLGGVLLTTYDMVRCNSKALRGDFTGRDGYGDTSNDIVTWDYIVLDEGHLVKNPNTQRAKSLREIPAGHRIVLSGTPIQNHLQEMWALFDFCCPDLLGDRKEFKEKYERQILAGTDKHASDRQKRIGSAVAQELRQKFGPFFLRRLKSEVFPESDDKDRKLSRKNDLIVWLRLSERQQKLYRAFLNSDTAEETRSSGKKVLAALTVMKKICDHPTLLTKRAANDIAEGIEGILDSADIAAAEAMTKSLAGMDDEDGRMGAPSCKIVFLMALLEDLVVEGHRTLVFSQTRKMLNIIQEEIMEKEWCFRRIDGTIKATEREQCVQEFQADDRISLFLLTSQVGGLGLTLTGADRVVIVDPAWNPSTDNQSVDRAYRIGQKKDVVVYRLMTCGTIEEKIYRKQVFKGHLMKVATEKKDQMRYFSQGELGEMFQVPETGFDVSLTQQQLHKEHFSQHKIDNELDEHIQFLEGLGIAGVSHHDLLFSKAAEPLPPPGPEEDLKATWEPRNPVYHAYKSKPASKEENHVWDSTHTSGRRLQESFIGWARQGILASAAARLQTPSDYDNLWLKVLFLRSKLERLSRTFEDKATLARLPDQGANIEKKIQGTRVELKEAEFRAASKENLGVQQPQPRPAAPPVISVTNLQSGSDLPPSTTSFRPALQQKLKPLGSNMIKPAPSGKQIIRPEVQDVQHGVKPVQPKPVREMPSWSLLSDSPSSSKESPAPTSTLNVDDMSEALSSLKLPLH